MSEPTIYFGDITVNTINGSVYPPPVPESMWNILHITGKDISNGYYAFAVNTPNYVYPPLLACYIDGEQYFPNTYIGDHNSFIIDFGRNSQISTDSKIELVFINK